MRVEMAIAIATRSGLKMIQPRRLNVIQLMDVMDNGDTALSCSLPYILEDCPHLQIRLSTASRDGTRVVLVDRHGRQRGSAN